jgi:hypothetical protein
MTEQYRRATGADQASSAPPGRPLLRRRLPVQLEMIFHAIQTLLDPTDRRLEAGDVILKMINLGVDSIELFVQHEVPVGQHVHLVPNVLEYYREVAHLIAHGAILRLVGG